MGYAAAVRTTRRKEQYVVWVTVAALDINTLGNITAWQYEIQCVCDTNIPIIISKIVTAGEVSAEEILGWRETEDKWIVIRGRKGHGP